MPKATPSMWGGGEEAKISRNMNPANFDKQLRETDAAITSVTSNLVVSPVTDSISDIVDNTTKKVEYLYSNRKGYRGGKGNGPRCWAHTPNRLK